MTDCGLKTLISEGVVEGKAEIEGVGHTVTETFALDILTLKRLTSDVF